MNNQVPTSGSQPVLENVEQVSNPSLDATPKPSAKRRFNLPKMPRAGNFKYISSKYKRLLVLFLSILIFLIVLGVLAPYLGKFVKRNGSGGNLATPTPTPSADEGKTPSIYANDSEVLDIEKKLQNIDEKYGNINVREDDLRPPSLDFNVKF